MPVLISRAAREQMQLREKFQQQQALQQQLFEQQQALQQQGQSGALEMEQLRQSGRLALQDDQQAYDQPEQQSRIGLRTAQTELASMQAAYLPMEQARAGMAAANAAVAQYADDVRKSFAPTREILTARQQVIAMLATGSALGSTAAVIKLAKALDPTSSVREGEVGTIEGGQGLVLQLQNAWNRMGGEGMSPKAIDAFHEVVNELVAPEALRAMQVVTGYEQEMSAAGVGDRFDSVLKTSGIDPKELTWLAMPAMTDEQLLILSGDG